MQRGMFLLPAALLMNSSSYNRRIFFMTMTLKGDGLDVAALVSVGRACKAEARLSDNNSVTYT